MELIHITVTKEDEGERLDTFISKKLSLTRSRVQNLIEENNIEIDNKKAKASLKIKENQIISVTIPDAKELDIVAENIELDILYEDDDVLVVNKPKGMVVHPAAGNYTGTLVNAIMAHCKDNLSSINGVIRPGIVHRIDKDTSGILVVAKNDNAHIKLAKQLKEHSMKRIYVAIVKGNLKDDKGTINAPIGRNPKERKKMAVVSGGRNAVTHYKVLKRLKDATIVELKLETGRTHQIRVHMSYIGHPLIGDTVYGSGKNSYGIKGQALHAKVLGFVHPVTNEYMEFSSPLPQEFQKLLAK
ncbi:MAG: RluA family pseudouridine synthase [Clostridia bacterium]|nr:RluA family pseudouridine synthase [Clostridia bacterium]